MILMRKMVTIITMSMRRRRKIKMMMRIMK